MFHHALPVNQIFGLLYTYSYLVLFPLVVIEGPITMIISGFLVSLGFMDFTPTYITIVMGDIVGDIIYYSAGRWWLNGAFKKVISIFKINMKLVRKLEKALKKHKGPFLFFGKLSHAIGGLILFAAGDAKIPMKDFLEFNFFATLPKSLILLGVGYYFGSAVTNFRKAVDFTVLGLFLFTVILVVLYFSITHLSNKYIKKLEK